VTSTSSLGAFGRMRSSRASFGVSKLGHENAWHSIAWYSIARMDGGLDIQNGV